ncbi:hypothetical protein H5410_024197 [Solanum commersonii]|uniref:Uncharacterized protein n=1 Tax=Solanum commersonii TaxID=4109 RepID=A0A9J5ZLB4_SOLCO|nr:hypothetical protein H5410_024197 [Solanum commersonii]
MEATLSLKFPSVCIDLFSPHAVIFSNANVAENVTFDIALVRLEIQTKYVRIQASVRHVFIDQHLFIPLDAAAQKSHKISMLKLGNIDNFILVLINSLHGTPNPPSPILLLSEKLFVALVNVDNWNICSAKSSLSSSFFFFFRLCNKKIRLSRIIAINNEKLMSVSIIALFLFEPASDSAINFLNQPW